MSPQTALQDVVCFLLFAVSHRKSVVFLAVEEACENWSSALSWSCPAFYFEANFEQKICRFQTFHLLR